MDSNNDGTWELALVVEQTGNVSKPPNASKRYFVPTRGCHVVPILQSRNLALILELGQYK